MRRFKRVFSAVVVLALMFSLSASALAAEYDLTIGDVAVSADASGQYVTQTNGVQNFKDETEIVITSNGVETSNTISIESSEEATAEVTISDVNIVVEDESAIYIKEGSDVVITVEGSNSVANTGEYMEALDDYAITKSAAVHVQDANLTIAGATGAEQDSLEVRAGTSLSTADGAAIGSDAGEAFSGSITIENVTVNAHSSCDGAAIGAGFFGTFAGEVNIQDGAEVLAEAAQNGAGIGSGYGGSFDEDGQVNITDSTVDAISQVDGAGIGAGASYEESESVKIGGNFAGSVSIDNSFVDAFSDSDGAGIGAGYKGDFDDTGSVTIGNGSVVVAYAENDGCGIGSGQYADFDGSIIIDDSVVNAWSEDEGAGIGASEGGNFNGSVTIRNGSEVTAESYDDGAGIGAGSPWMNSYGENQGSHFTGDVVIEDSDVKAIGDGGAAGIGAGDNGGSFSGSVSIHNSTVYAEAESGGTAIGAGELVWNEETETFDGGDFTGSITVTGKSDLYLYNLNYFNLLGASDEEKGSGTVTFGPEVTLYDAAYDNGIIQREEYPEFIFARLRFQSSGAAGAVGDVAGSVVDTFWRDVEKQIRAAEKGDKITVDAGKRTSMPAFVMDAIEECEIILVIQWDGGEDIVIEEAYDGEVPYRVFQLAELAELLEND